jgi:hypothetical protein
VADICCGEFMYCQGWTGERRSNEKLIGNDLDQGIGVTMDIIQTGTRLKLFIIFNRKGIGQHQLKMTT